MALGLIIGRLDRIVANSSQDSGELNVSPIASVANRSSEIRHLLIVLDARSDILIDEAEVARIDIIARMLQRHRGHPVRVLQEGETDLRRARIHLPRRTPVIENVREDVAIHPQSVRLAG